MKHKRSGYDPAKYYASSEHGGTVAKKLSNPGKYEVIKTGYGGAT